MTNPVIEALARLLLALPNWCVPFFPDRVINRAVDLHHWREARRTIRRR